MLVAAASRSFQSGGAARQAIGGSTLQLGGQAGSGWRHKCCSPLVNVPVDLPPSQIQRGWGFFFWGGGANSLLEQHVIWFTLLTNMRLLWLAFGIALEYQEQSNQVSLAWV